MWFVLLSSAFAQDVQSTTTDDGAEFTLSYRDGETVTARFHGGVFATRDAERAMAQLGDHLFDNMDVFSTGGGGGSWVDIDLDGPGADLADDGTGDILGVDDPSRGSTDSMNTSVGDVLVSFGIDFPEAGEDDRGEEPDGFRAQTGAVADGDTESEYASGSDINFDTDPEPADPWVDSVDAVYADVMNDLFGGDEYDPHSDAPSLDPAAHETVHVVQSGQGRVQDMGWEGTLPSEFEIESAIEEPWMAAEANINWNVLGVSMYVQPDPTHSDEDIVESEDGSPILLIGEALEFAANEAYLRDDSSWDTDPSPRGE